MALHFFATFWRRSSAYRSLLSWKPRNGLADEASALPHNGVIYRARNLLALYPQARRLWGRQAVIDLLTAVLGEGFGLVRGLYFDKPPHGNWSLPWHQDLTIAVKDHSLPSEHFRNRTLKAGVPHVEAPDEVLRQMLTLPIHVDDATRRTDLCKCCQGLHSGATQPPIARRSRSSRLQATYSPCGRCYRIAADRRTTAAVVIVASSISNSRPTSRCPMGTAGMNLWCDANVAAQKPR